MSKITLTNLVNLENENTAVSAINANNATLTTALDNTLSRDGTTPNQMTAVIDMNGNQIYNLPAPSTVNSPARLIDVTTNPTIVIPGTGTSGHTVPFLDGNNTWSGTNTFGTVTATTENVTTLNVSGTATFSSTPVLPANSIANASLATMAVNTAKGSIAGGTPVDLSKTQLTTLINPFTTSLPGAAPASGGGTTNFLRADGNWASPPTQAITLLNTLTASSSATISDTTSLTATYPGYEIVWYNVIPSTNAVNLFFRVHAASAFQSTSYFTNSFFTQASNAVVADTPTTEIELCHSLTVASAGTPGCSGRLRIYNVNGTSFAKNVFGETFYFGTGGATTGVVGGFWNNTAAVDGFLFAFSTGTILSGTFKVYGIT